MQTKLVFLQTLSGLHCGIGRGVSDIDAPTARDMVTGHPVVPGTSFKGVLRDQFSSGVQADASKQPKFLAAFGPDNKSQATGVDLAAAASFGDLRLLCLPVRSYFGTFAWVTSPGVLRWFQQDAQRTGNSITAGPLALAGAPNYECGCTATSVLRMPANPNSADLSGKVLLEELDLEIKVSEEINTTLWATAICQKAWPADLDTQNTFSGRLLIVHDEIFDYLCETGLPVIARNRIGEQGVAERGALWYEEQVPHEAIFWGLLHVDDARGPTRVSAADLCAYLTSRAVEVQIGGDATTGKGFVRVTFA